LRRSNPESFPRRRSGLLRFARNDGVCTTMPASIDRSLPIPGTHTPSHSRDILCPSFAAITAPESAEGAGKAGCRLAPAVRCAQMRKKQMHSGIQVKPNIRPSLRSGFTAYVVLSSGSDALLPPSPCGWLMRGPGWAATSPQHLAHRPRAPGPHDFAVRGLHRSCARGELLTE
jgi:hypothetical protein